MSEEIFDEENWKKEAAAVINDIKHHVKLAEVSRNLQATDQLIYFNLTTLENENFCVELSANGFRITGLKHDENNVKDGEYYETPYALLNKFSPLFQLSFGNSLMSKLEGLKRQN